jgi:hypothetical protein
MKKFRILIFLALLTGSVAVNAMSKPPHNGGGGCVSTPLDGGLLSVLGAAGVVYLMARKGKKKEL